ncbi:MULTISPECIES: helix-turn-helix domain-containing protein [unclassified Streptomyces]|uniref:helix-turn-helix domain-containing protein n=1 Tax=unclassified Streptomyces TaxID=2593676 RepID=UPI00081AEB6B|nr:MULTISPECIES: XRE family transcriptional regulator [unclassified Streptomyces]MYQ53430.1 DUF2690 domain-containing protein [Streptomyces sp. SID4941]SCE04870.1 Helix-turn-helix domain-containing protein [Streptomyces sp. PalvLS-984]SDD96412.1 Helix-turn-helix domain-containing protein [Streptomyces sp. AmelKG-A3]
MPRWKALPQELDPQVREFAGHVRRLIDRSGLGLAAVADRTGYSKTSWERYLNGRLLPPKGAVVALAEVTGTHPAHLTTLWELAERAWSRAEMRHDMTMEAIRISQARAALAEATTPTTAARPTAATTATTAARGGRAGRSPDTARATTAAPGPTVAPEPVLGPGAAGAREMDPWREPVWEPLPPRRGGSEAPPSGLRRPRRPARPYGGTHPHEGGRPSTADGPHTTDRPHKAFRTTDRPRGTSRPRRTARSHERDRPGDVRRPDAAPGPDGRGGRRRTVTTLLAGALGALLVTAAAVLLTGLGAGDGDATADAAPSTAPGPVTGVPRTSDGVGCVGADCTGQDPEAMGCGGQFASTTTRATVGGRLVEVRYSKTCAAAWARLTEAEPGDTVRVEAGSVRQDGTVDADRDAYTPMVAVEDAADARACATLTSGRTGCAAPG